MNNWVKEGNIIVDGNKVLPTGLVLKEVKGIKFSYFNGNDTELYKFMSVSFKEVVVCSFVVYKSKFDKEHEVCSMRIISPRLMNEINKEESSTFSPFWGSLDENKVDGNISTDGDINIDMIKFLLFYGIQEGAKENYKEYKESGLFEIIRDEMYNTIKPVEIPNFTGDVSEKIVKDFNDFLNINHKYCRFGKVTASKEMFRGNVITKMKIVNPANEDRLRGNTNTVTYTIHAGGIIAGSDSGTSVYGQIVYDSEGNYSIKNIFMPSNDIAEKCVQLKTLPNVFMHAMIMSGWSDSATDFLVAVSFNNSSTDRVCLSDFNEDVMKEINDIIGCDEYNGYTFKFTNVVCDDVKVFNKLVGICDVYNSPVIYIKQDEPIVIDKYITGPIRTLVLEAPSVKYLNVLRGKACKVEVILTEENHDKIESIVDDIKNSLAVGSRHFLYSTHTKFNIITTHISKDMLERVKFYSGIKLVPRNMRTLVSTLNSGDDLILEPDTFGYNDTMEMLHTHETIDRVPNKMKRLVVSLGGNRDLVIKLGVLSKFEKGIEIHGVNSNHYVIIHDRLKELNEKLEYIKLSFNTILMNSISYNDLKNVKYSIIIPNSGELMGDMNCLSKTLEEINLMSAGTSTLDVTEFKALRELAMPKVTLSGVSNSLVNLSLGEGSKLDGFRLNLTNPNASYRISFHGKEINDEIQAFVDDLKEQIKVNSNFDVMVSFNADTLLRNKF